MNGPLEWIGAIGAILAAALIAADLGRRVTGWGFALFVTSSVAWIAGALISGDAPLWSQNLVLFCINCFGVYRYLIRKRAPRDHD